MASLPSANAADTSVSGIVRDKSGIPQINALVELMNGDSAVIALARTNEHGAFTLAPVLPGVYQLKATEISFLPALRQDLQVLANQRTVANVTLGTLFDPADWLPAQRRPAAEPVDDWKWTLRSSANRPLLRFANDITDAAGEEAHVRERRVRVTTSQGARAFGEGGLRTEVEAESSSTDGQRTLLRAAGGAKSQGTAECLAGFEVPLGYGRTLRTAAGFVQQPLGLPGAGARAVQAAFIRTGESMELTPSLIAEFGDEIAAISADTEQVSSHPFANVTWRTGGASVAYMAATSVGMQQADSLADDDTEMPALTEQHGHITLQHGLHQEVRFRYQSGEQTETILAVYSDRLANPILNGGGIASAADATGGELLLDPVAAVFRATGPAYSGQGFMARTDARVSPSVTFSAAYMQGSALAMPHSSRTAASLQRTLDGVQVRNAQAITVGAHGQLERSGTRWRASYRWQPSGTLTPVDPYDNKLQDAYLSLFLRQPIHLGRVFPGGMEALVNVRNLLAEGYYPFVTSDGSTLFFAQVDRSVQGGIAFTF